MSYHVPLADKDVSGKKPCRVFAPQKLEVQKLARMPIFEPHHFRHGWRADKTTTSFLNEKLEVQKLARTPIFEPHPCRHRQRRRCTKSLPSFSNEKLEVHELTRKSIRAPNTDVAHYQGRQSIYNICILNDCKLTFEFFKNYIFEKRRQFLKKQSKGNA